MRSAQALKPIRDEEYYLRLKNAHWNHGIPQEFIDPDFKTIKDNCRFVGWLLRVEHGWTPQAIEAWLHPVEYMQAILSGFYGQLVFFNTILTADVKEVNYDDIDNISEIETKRVRSSL